MLIAVTFELYPVGPVTYSWNNSINITLALKKKTPKNQNIKRPKIK